MVETHRASQRYADIDDSTFFWHAIIFLTAFCPFMWKAIEQLRNRKKCTAAYGSPRLLIAAGLLP